MPESKDKGIKSLNEFNDIFHSINSLRQQLHALENEREAKWHRIDGLEDEAAEKRRYVYKKIHGDKGVKGHIKKCKAFLPDLLLKEEELEKMKTAIEANIAKAKEVVQQKKEELVVAQEEEESCENALVDIKKVAGEADRIIGEQKQTNSEVQEQLNAYYAKIRDKGAIIENFDIDSFRDLKFSANEARSILDFYSSLMEKFAGGSDHASLQIQKSLSVLCSILERIEDDARSYYEKDRMSDEDNEFLATSEYGILRREYFAFRKSQFEDKRILLRRQQNLMTDIHTYFDEYRVASEFLFNSHAAQLGEKLLEQEREYNNELCSTMIESECRYDDVVAEKDAKTLELIEGSDPAMQQMAHEMKVAQERRKHQQRLRKLHQQEFRALDPCVDELEDKIESQKLLMLMLGDRVRAAQATADRLMRSAKERGELADMFERECRTKAHEQDEELRKLREENTALRGKREYFHNKLLTTKCAVVDSNRDKSLLAVAERLASEVNKLTSEDEGHRRTLSQGIKEREKRQQSLMKELRFYSGAATRLKHETASLASLREEVDSLIKNVMKTGFLSLDHSIGAVREGGGSVADARDDKAAIQHEIGRISDALDRFSRLSSTWGQASVGSLAEGGEVKKWPVRLPTPRMPLSVYESK